MRVTNQRAEENQRRARGAVLLKPRESTVGVAPLMTVRVAGASDVEGVEAGSSRGQWPVLLVSSLIALFILVSGKRAPGPATRSFPGRRRPFVFLLRQDVSERRSAVVALCFQAGLVSYIPLASESLCYPPLEHR